MKTERNELNSVTDSTNIFANGDQNRYKMFLFARFIRENGFNLLDR